MIFAVIAFINLAIFLYRDEHKRTNDYLKFMLIIVLLANMGYLALAISSTLSEALLANKICYLGGYFLPPITTACICTLCNIKLSKGVKYLCVAFSTFVYGLVLTTGYWDFYYKSASLGREFDAATVVK